MGNTKKKTPNPAGKEGRPISLAPLTEAEALRGLLLVKPKKKVAAKKKATTKKTGQ